VCSNSARACFYQLPFICQWKIKTPPHQSAKHQHQLPSTIHITHLCQTISLLNSSNWKPYNPSLSKHHNVILPSSQSANPNQTPNSKTPLFQVKLPKSPSKNQTPYHSTINFPKPLRKWVEGDEMEETLTWVHFLARRHCSPSTPSASNALIPSSTVDLPSRTPTTNLFSRRRIWNSCRPCPLLTWAAARSHTIAWASPPESSAEFSWRRRSPAVPSPSAHARL